MDLASIRGQFPATDRWTYLETASNGPLPTVAAEAVRTFLADAQANGRSGPLWQDGRDRARAGFARLIGADPADVVFAKNATEGVNIVAAGLDAEAGDNIVICGDLEHPANITPWLALREKGVELRLIAGDRQAIPAAAMAAAVDARTRAVAVSTVTFMPGFRTDLAPISAAARRFGALLLVDATQSAGVLQTDVRAMGVDALATSTHKYLLGMFGQGFLYLAPEWAARLTPVFVGAAGYQDPEAHPAAANFAWAPADGARRFETGHAYASSAAVAASLELLLAVGPAATEAHACGLADDLARGFIDVGWSVNADPFGLPQSQIVTLGEIAAGDLYAVGDPDLARLHAVLAEAGVRHSARRGALRFSLHLFNDASDVAKTLDVAEAVRRQAA